MASVSNRNKYTFGNYNLSSSFSLNNYNVNVTIKKALAHSLHELLLHDNAYM